MATLKQPLKKNKPEFEPEKARGEKEGGQEKPVGEKAQQVKAMEPDKTSNPVSYVTERGLTPPGGALALAHCRYTLPCTVNKQTNLIKI